MNHFRPFTLADLDTGRLHVQHNLGQMYNHIEVYNNLDTRVMVPATPIDAQSLWLDLTDSMPISGTWHIAVSTGHFFGEVETIENRMFTFSEEDLTVSGHYLAVHNFGEQISLFQVYDDTYSAASPPVIASDQNTLTVDMSAFRPLVGPWRMVVSTGIGYHVQVRNENITAVNIGEPIIGYDLTGTHPDWLEEDDRHVVHSTPQTIKLRRTAFSSSIQVWKITNTGNTLLTQNVDWYIAEENRDHQAVSDAKLRDPMFVSNLAHSVTALHTDPDGDYQILITYQALRRPMIDEDTGVDGPVCAPGLIRYMLERLEYLLHAKNPLKQVLSDYFQEHRLLAEDLTGIDPDNRINNEIHVVNVPQNKQVIRPGAGSFYRHNLILTRVLDNYTLVDGVDYVIVGCNLPKTKASFHTSGVYDYIFLVTPLVGDIKIAYHAYGGEVTQMDVNHMRDFMASLWNFLNESDVITNHTIGYTPVVKDLARRLKIVEEHLRHYPVAVHTIVSENPAKHWYSIAYLHAGIWSDELIVTKDVGQIRVELRAGCRIFDVMTITNTKRFDDQFRVNVLAFADSYSHEDFREYSKIDRRELPEFRLVWNGDGSVSGAVLQLGIAMTFTPSSDTIKVTDRGGYDGAWFLYPGSDTPIGYTDDDVALPTEGHVWSSTSSIANYKRSSVWPHQGYLAWAGNQLLDEMRGTNWRRLRHLIRSDEIIPENIKRVYCHIYDRREDRYLTVSGDHIGGTLSRVEGSLIFDPENMCFIKYRYRYVNNLPVLEVLAVMDAHSVSIHRYDLRQIVFGG